jgi:hypothetical protein
MCSSIFLMTTQVTGSKLKPNAFSQGNIAATAHAGRAPPEKYPGSDFYVHSSPWEVDVAALRLDPAPALACGEGCALDWARRWFAAHLQVGLAVASGLQG